MTEEPQEPQKPQWPTWRILAVFILGVLVILAILSALASNDESTSPTPLGLPTVEVRTEPVDLCWSGAFGNRTVDGCGDSTVELPSSGGSFAATAQKQGESGSLTLVLRNKGKVLDSATTSAAYGVVSVAGVDE
jgi:hypothetical protein